MGSPTADAATPIRGARLRWAVLAMVVAGWIAFSGIARWRERHAILINASESLPNWAFVIDRHGVPRRGAYVFFEPPRNRLVRRHFGKRPQLFGKIVFGEPGDIVSRDGPLVRINGRLVGRLKRVTRLGEPLAAGATGLIPRGCFYAGSPHPDGFDSRYAAIGFVCRDQIVGVGTAIL